MKDLKVVMMGLGYMGLPTAAVIASEGIIVHGVDVDQSVVNIINSGKIHIIEPELDGLVKNVVDALIKDVIIFLSASRFSLVLIFFSTIDAHALLIASTKLKYFTVSNLDIVLSCNLEVPMDRFCEP